MSGNAEITYEPSGCNCDGTSYSKQDINTAATKALQLASQGKTEGTSALTRLHSHDQLVTESLR